MPNLKGKTAVARKTTSRATRCKSRAKTVEQESKIQLIGNKRRRRDVSADIQNLVANSAKKICGQKSKNKEVNVPDGTSHESRQIEPVLEQVEVTASFIEDDNYVDMNVQREEERREFPSPSDEEESSDSETEDSIKNNATVKQKSNSAQSSSQGASYVARQQLPGTSNDAPRLEREVMTQAMQQFRIPKIHTENRQPDLGQTLNMVQDFMLKKGLIQTPLNKEEFKELMMMNEHKSPCPSPTEKTKRTANTPSKKSGKRFSGANKSPSEVTIYKRVVPLIDDTNAHEVTSRQIDEYIRNVRE